ncbi:DUF975 family protein [Eubacterium multiforme]|uniref:Membrane protein n=1 Tax=Eubacterium multiforme TaxID=83339 RepID=A0ABT9US98_9FIRM|nr:DUF975 family protein [Eubacterium multiforme]MDQ0149193.1 putative membrane protein [Eubacterium multiforme]
MINRDIKKLSREELKGNWIKFALLTLGVMIVSSMIIYIFSKIFNDNMQILQKILSVALTALVSCFSTLVYLHFSRSNEFSLKAGKRPYSNYLRYMVLILLYYIVGALIAVVISFIIVTLGFIGSVRALSDYSHFSAILAGATVAIVVLIIIAAVILFIIKLFYLMSIYMIADGYGGIFECLGRSARMMKGNKFKLFKLMLSFIGWFILSIITLGIGLLWVMPYYSLSLTNFYLDLNDEINNKDLDESVCDNIIDDLVKDATELPKDSKSEE